MDGAQRRARRAETHDEPSNPSPPAAACSRKRIWFQYRVQLNGCRREFGGSSSGRTTDSDSVYLGSNPSPPAKTYRGPPTGGPRRFRRGRDENRRFDKFAGSKFGRPKAGPEGARLTMSRAILVPQPKRTEARQPAGLDVFGGDGMRTAPGTHKRGLGLNVNRIRQPRAATNSACTSAAGLTEDSRTGGRLVRHGLTESIELAAMRMRCAGRSLWRIRY